MGKHPEKFAYEFARSVRASAWSKTWWRREARRPTAGAGWFVPVVVAGCELGPAMVVCGSSILVGMIRCRDVELSGMTRERWLWFWNFGPLSYFLDGTATRQSRDINNVHSMAARFSSTAASMRR